MKKSFLLSINIMWATTYASDSATYLNYLWANYNQFTGNMNSAQQWYKKVLGSKGSVYTYKGYVNFLFDTNQFEAIVNLIPTISSKFEKDPELQLLFALALEQSGKKEESYGRIIALSDTFKSDAEITFRAAQIYMNRKEYTNAIKILDSYLNSTPRRPNNFIFYFLKSTIFINLNKFDEALQNVEKCLEMHPHFNKGWLLFASLQEQKGKLKEAIKGYSIFLELSSGDPEIEQHLFSLMLKYKLTEENQQTLILDKSCLEGAVTLFKRKQYKQALLQINKCLNNNPQDVDSRLLKIDILAAMNNIDLALVTLTNWFEINPENPLWIKATYFLIHAGALPEKVISTLKTFENKQPNSLPIHLYLADLYLRNQNHKQALNYLENALQCTADKNLQTKIIYQMGLLYYENEQFDAMKNILERGYNLEANFTPLYNTLAYYYCTKGKNIERAQQLITKALNYESNNPHYLDTQALIWYKQKNYDQSCQLLEKLALQESTDATILLHLAKVYNKLNNNDKSALYAKKAENYIHHNHEKRLYKTVQQRLNKNFQ